MSVDEVPRELLREVAAQTKSLSRALPYPEYAAIVRHIAGVKWRYHRGTRREANPITYAANAEQP